MCMKLKGNVFKMKHVVMESIHKSKPKKAKRDRRLGIISLLTVARARHAEKGGAICLGTC